MIAVVFPKSDGKKSVECMINNNSSAKSCDSQNRDEVLTRIHFQLLFQALGDGALGHTTRSFVGSPCADNLLLRLILASHREIYQCKVDRCLLTSFLLHASDFVAHNFPPIGTVVVRLDNSNGVIVIYNDSLCELWSM